MRIKKNRILMAFLAYVPYVLAPVLYFTVLLILLLSYRLSYKAFNKLSVNIRQELFR
jgi:hypothetical protein